MAERVPVEYPVSAGGVVYRVRDGVMEVVLGQRKGPRTWNLPKGTPVAGESMEEAALREVGEEAGIAAQDVDNLHIRVVLTRLEDGDVTTVVFFTGHTDHEALRRCDEGRLQWIELDRIADLDLVENAGYALNLALQEKKAGFPDVYVAVEDGMRCGTVSALRVDRAALGRLPRRREVR